MDIFPTQTWKSDGPYTHAGPLADSMRDADMGARAIRRMFERAFHPLSVGHKVRTFFRTPMTGADLDQALSATIDVVRSTSATHEQILRSVTMLAHDTMLMGRAHTDVQWRQTLGTLLGVAARANTTVALGVVLACQHHELQRLWDRVDGPARNALAMEWCDIVNNNIRMTLGHGRLDHVELYGVGIHRMSFVPDEVFPDFLSGPSAVGRALAMADCDMSQQMQSLLAERAVALMPTEVLVNHLLSYDSKHNLTHADKALSITKGPARMAQTVCAVILGSLPPAQQRDVMERNPALSDLPGIGHVVERLILENEVDGRHEMDGAGAPARRM